MELNRETAEVIINGIHLAWSTGDVPRLLEFFTPDFVYRNNLPDDKGRPRLIEGRDAFGQLLRRKLELMESVTTVEHFSYLAGIARMHVSHAQRHKATGLKNNGSFRQFAVFRASQVAVIEEFHDAPMIAAFWKLAESRGG